MTSSPQMEYFQDGLHGNHCFGCGAWNDKGLRIKSYWDWSFESFDGDKDRPDSVCVFHPEPHHAAMPPDVMNGGIIASVIDCHSVCTAIAEAYRLDGRNVGEGPVIWYATASLTVNYRKPTRIDGPITVRSRITEIKGKRTMLSVKLFDHKGEMTCDGDVVAVRVPDEWADPEGLLKHIEGG